VQLPLGTGAGEPVRVELGASLSADLRLAARRLRATPFMTALAAFSVLVGRMTGLDDLLLATVVAHRNDSDLEPLIGCFTKKVPLRIRVEGDPTFAELVARARAALVGALAHQDLAFDAAVYEGVGQVAAQHGIVPQVSVVFQGEAPQRERLALPGLVTSRYETGGASREERHFSTTDREGPVWGDGIYLGSFVLVSFVDAPDGMALVVRGVFDRPAGRRVLEAFRSLLVAVVAAPSEPLSTFAVDVAHPVGGDDVIDVRGFRSRRSRLEAALGRAPGVAEVAVVVEDGELVARVAAAGEPPPTLAQLRQALWGALPGAPWPARAVLVDGTPLGPGPPATLLPAMWAELAGRPVAAGDSYWQDFSFLPVLAEAREAGLAITDQQVVRCRTPEMLATAMAVAPLPRD
ncbi:MAG TPA: condensation domain-containing protein, partial [Acidimicrobiales bacterium]|nr:condensation domain-containing protein [Acidimicrobiales bacterium]